MPHAQLSERKKKYRLDFKSSGKAMFVYLTLGKQLWDLSPDQRIISMAMMTSLSPVLADAGAILMLPLA
jgi:hypothetical protein